jgi:hypothetical protein
MEMIEKEKGEEKGGGEKKGEGGATNKLGLAGRG